MINCRNSYWIALPYGYLVLTAFLLFPLRVSGQEVRIPRSAEDSFSSALPMEIVRDVDPLYTAINYSPRTLRWHSMFTKIPGDLKQLGMTLTQQKNFTLLAGVALATIGFQAVDKQIWNWTKPNFEYYNTRSSSNKYMVGIGDGRTHIAVAGAFATYGFIVDDQRALRTASQSIEAILVTGLTVQVLKRITGRESPATASDPGGIWKPFTNPWEYERHQSRYYSFPSGHTASTVAVITVISENYPEWKWVKPAGFVLVGLLEAGLVNAGMHWISDFPLAVMLGYTCGMISSDPVTPNADGIPLDKSSDIKIKPILTPLGTQVGMTLNF